MPKTNLRAEWDAAYTSALPDSAFAYIEGGGSKDDSGRTTPRSLRHFPHHDSSGEPDAAHVRNALARIPQSSVSQTAKDEALAHVRGHASALGIGDERAGLSTVIGDEDEAAECAICGQEQAAHAAGALGHDYVASASRSDPSVCAICGEDEESHDEEDMDHEFTPSRAVGQHIERRFLPVTELRIEKRHRSAPPTLVGHAAVFDMLSDDLGGFRERIRAGAFREAVRQDVRALVNHDANLVLGRSSAGTLRVAEDQKGLAYEIDLPNTTYARDLAELIRRGDVRDNSFGFLVGPGGDRWSRENGGVVRDVTNVSRLADVSVVTYPAYPATDVAMRGLADGSFRWSEMTGVLERARMGSASDLHVVREALRALDRVAQGAQGRVPPRAARELAAAGAAAVLETERARLSLYARRFN